MPVAIDQQVAADDRIAGRRRRLGSPQRDADPREELFRAERLGDVVVRAGVQRVDLVGLGAPGRQHDDRHGPPVADQTAHLDAVHVRQPEVEDDEIGAVALDAAEGRAARHGGRHLVAARPQQRRHGRENPRLVVDDQDLQRHVTTPGARPDAMWLERQS